MQTPEELCKKYFGKTKHPYKTYEEYIEKCLQPEFILLDAGCGRSAPVLQKFVGKARALIGVDLEDGVDCVPHVRYLQGDIESMDVQDSTVDVVISRAVLEHVQNPESVFREINRVLKPGGRFVFLVPNLGDYASIASKIIPNRFHQRIVSKMERRNAADVFPAYYRANTYGSIKRIADTAGFAINHFEYLGQYPAYFMFNSYLFLLATLYEKTISKFESLRFLRGWLLVELKKLEC